MKAIAIGASSGGPSALEHVVRALPAELPAIVIILQHLPRYATATLVAHLGTLAPLPVSQVENGMHLEAGHIYVVPGSEHFFILGPEKIARLIPAYETLSPSIDMGFTSVADHFGPKTIGVVLSGMGNDGMIGAKAIQQVGGYTIAQDEATSAVYGMPKAVNSAGYADEVLPLDAIAGRLIALVRYH